MPAGLTYETVATTTIVSATSSVTFSSISGSYTDLVLIINAKGTGFSGSGTYPYVRYNSITHFADYSNTTTHKCIISRANNSSVQTDLLVGLWRSTSAITSIAIYSSSGNFDTGSTFTLYGITAA